MIKGKNLYAGAFRSLRNIIKENTFIERPVFMHTEKSIVGKKITLCVQI